MRSLFRAFMTGSFIHFKHCLSSVGNYQNTPRGGEGDISPFPTSWRLRLVSTFLGFWVLLIPGPLGPRFDLRFAFTPGLVGLDLAWALRARIVKELDLLIWSLASQLPNAAGIPPTGGIPTLRCQPLLCSVFLPSLPTFSFLLPRPPASGLVIYRGRGSFPAI